MLSGSRICHHLRECHHHHRHRHQRQELGFGFALGLGFCHSRTVQLSASTVRPPSSAVHSEKRSNTSYSSSSSSIDFGLPLVGCIQPKSPHEDIPLLSDRFSYREDNRECPSEGLSTVAGGIVALGKFDALHIGHRELVIQAAKVGVPFLLSFVGMAEVLGWEPRDPIVARCDRKRVLSSWVPYCGVTPKELQVEFSKVRHLSPCQFVEKLSKELGVRGVVAGENYRFGYRAAGDAAELLRLCEEYGMEAYIINSVMDKNRETKDIETCDLKDRGQVSSTRVRHALAKGDMKYVSELLGRQHRLMLAVEDQKWLASNHSSVSAPRSYLLNLPPKEGIYESCSLFIGEEKSIPCRVTIDETHIHLQFNEVASCILTNPQDLRFLSIDFGGA